MAINPLSDLVAGAHTLRRNDVTALAVLVHQQRNVRASVRVVLDGGDLGGHAVLDALEVDDAVTLLVSTALMTNRDPTVVIATTLRRLLVEKRRMRFALVQLRRLDGNDESATRGCRFGFMQ